MGTNRLYNPFVIRRSTVPSDGLGYFSAQLALRSEAIAQESTSRSNTVQANGSELERRLSVLWWPSSSGLSPFILKMRLSPWILRQERAFLEDRQKNNIVSLKGKSRSCGQKNKYKRQEKKGGQQCPLDNGKVAEKTTGGSQRFQE